MVAVGTGLAVGGLLDYLTGREYNEALQDKTASDQAMVRKKQDDALRMLGTSDTPWTTRNINESGGITEKRIGGPQSAKVQELATFGDYGRQLAANEATRDFDFSIPDLQTAQGIVDRDDALTQGARDRMFHQAALRTGQTDLGPASSNYSANLMDAMSRASDKTRFNREQRAGKLLQESQQGEINNLIKFLQAQQLHAPAPAFQDRTPGATAAQVITQMPTRDFAVDASPIGLGAQAGSNLVGQLMAYEQTEADRRAQADLIRQLGDAGAFKGTTAPVVGT